MRANEQYVCVLLTCFTFLFYCKPFVVSCVKFFVIFFAPYVCQLIPRKVIINIA